MAQLFAPRADLVLRTAIAFVLLAGAGTAWGAYVALRSPPGTAEGRYVVQPVPFSHAHHVGGLGLDCRYCHRWASVSSHAGLPDTETCMHCHHELWTDAPVLEPVRESWRTGEPIAWRRVHDLPDHVFFDHSAHLNGGVGCESCHGRVDRMPLVARAAPLQMGWCLDCHRDPGPRLRPPEALHTMGWSPPDDGGALAAALLERWDTPSTAVLTDCSACHR